MQCSGGIDAQSYSRWPEKEATAIEFGREMRLDAVNQQLPPNWEPLLPLP